MNKIPALKLDGMENREVVFTMTDSDFIKLHENESSVFQIKLVEKSSPKRSHRIISPKSLVKANLYHSDNDIKLNNVIDKKTKLNKSDSSINTIKSNTETVKDVSPIPVKDVSPIPVEMRRRKRSSSSKSATRSKTDDTEIKKRSRSCSKITRSKTAEEMPIKIITQSVIIDNIVYPINYKTNNLYYNVFKIEKVMDNIFCSGIHDYCVSSQFLITNHYDIKTFVYENLKYEIIYTTPLDCFKLPMYICEYTNQRTAIDFIFLLPNILDGFTF